MQWKGSTLVNLYNIIFGIILHSLQNEIRELYFCSTSRRVDAFYHTGIQPIHEFSMETFSWWRRWFLFNTTPKKIFFTHLLCQYQGDRVNE